MTITKTNIESKCNSITITNRLLKLKQQAILKLYKYSNKFTRYQLQCSSRSLLHSFVPDWITATVHVLFGLPANLIQRLQSVQNAAARLIFITRRSEHITPALISLHWLRIPDLLQTVSYDVSIHPRHLSVLPTVVFHPRFIQTTAAVFHLTSSGRSARSSLYSRQAGVSGFWCHRLERPASPRRICAVTRGFQTTTRDLSVFPFLPRHYHMTRV